jgi:hypothetical protein
MLTWHALRLFSVISIVRRHALHIVQRACSDSYVYVTWGMARMCAKNTAARIRNPARAAVILYRLIGGDMSETKFGVLASLCYMLAFTAMAAGVIFAVSRQTGNLRVDTTLFAVGAVTLAFWGFVFHAFHTSTLRRDALLTEIRDAITTRTKAADAPDKAWLIGQREKR